MSLYEGAVKKPIMTSLCFLAVAIFGLFSLSKLPIDLMPDIETNTIMVMTLHNNFIFKKSSNEHIFKIIQEKRS